jgi:hypothetical protein
MAAALNDEDFWFQAGFAEALDRKDAAAISSH